MTSTGSIQGGSTTYSVTVSTTNPAQYTLEFPAGTFTEPPVMAVTPIGGPSVAGLSQVLLGDGRARVVISFTAPTLFNFIASNLSS